MKQCTKCSEIKPLIEYPKGHNRCVSCRDKYMENWRNENRNKINTNQRKYQQTLKGRSSVLLNAAKKRARIKNEPFHLTLEDVIKGISSGYCCKTLLPFDLEFVDRWRQYKINPMSPSIDKINPNGIYEVGNVQYVCSWYNLAKGQMTETDLIMFCKQIARLYV